MTALVLTLVVVIGWVGVIALGYWHGGWRQVVVLAGILLSYAVLSEWAGPNGRDLTAQFGWPLAQATTIVALLYLVVGTAILGYLGGMLLPRPAPLSSYERGLGALMGILNGGLLLALALRILRSYAFAPGEGQILRASLLARALIEQVGYLLMAAFVVGLGAVIAGVVRARRPVATAVTADALPERATVTPIAPAAPAAADPYDGLLDIDWPATSPSGTMPSPAARNASYTPPTAQSAPVAVLPMALRLPPRVTPPLWHPTAALMGARRTPAAVLSGVPDTAPAPPVPPQRVPPALPALPPPGVPFIPPVASTAIARPPAEEPVIVREADTRTGDSTPAEAVPVPTTHTETPNSPVPAAALAPNDAPEREAVAQAAEPPLEAARPAPEARSPPAPEPTALPVTAVRAGEPLEPAMTTASLPAIPPTAPPPPRAEAVQRPRNSSFARVAQPRQPERPERPVLPLLPPAEERGPLRPPLPTGPDVYGCPTCRYPVRRHARYCPNCGTRLR